MFRPCRHAKALGGGATLSLLLAVYLALALAYSVLVPIGETPDEIGHVQFVDYVATHRKLPVQELRPNNEVGEGHQAPLYYILAAIPSALVDTSDLATFRINPGVSFAVDGARNKHTMLHTVGEGWPYTGYVLGWHLARLVSVLFGALAVGLAYRFGRVAFRGDRALALATAAVFALNPEFVFISAAASNDALATALGTALLLVVAELLAGRRPTVRVSALLGALAGAAVLTKLTLAIPAALAGAVLAYRLRRTGERPWRQVVAGGLAGVAIAGWWFARNLCLYGDALALNVDRAQNPSLVRGGPPDLALVKGLLLVARDSYFARFGWMNVAPPVRVYDGLTVALALAALGLAILVARRALAAGSSPCSLSVLALGLGCLLALLLAQFVFAVSKGPSAYQGRYLFPAAAGVAAGLVAGWAQLLGFRARWAVAGGVSLAGAAFSLYCLFQVILPTYPEPLPIFPPSKAVRPPLAVGASVGEEFALVGCDCGEAGTSWIAGGRGKVVLYWRSLRKTAVNYTVFVHLVDGQGRLVAQSDGWPARDQLPTSLWLPGEQVLDSHELDLGSVAPGRYRLYIGMYNLADMRRLPVVMAGQPPTDRVELERRVGP